MNDLVKSKSEWLILGGCPRSGTTLLNMVINTSEDIFLSNEQNLYRSMEVMRGVFYREKHVLSRTPRKLSKNEQKVGDYKDQVLEATISEKYLADAIEALYHSSLVGNHIGSPAYLGDKFPKYYHWNLDELESTLGGVKYIHVTRSPIDVINSCVGRANRSLKGDDWWPIESVEAYVVEWIRAWNFALNHRGSENFLHIKYEDFVERPEQTLKDVSSFLNLSTSFETTDIYNKPSVNILTRGQQYTISKCLSNECLSWEGSIDSLMDQVGEIDNSSVTNLLTEIYYKLLRGYKRYKAK